MCTTLLCTAVVCCCRKHVKQCGLLDNTYIAQKVDDDRVAVPVVHEFVRNFSLHSDHHRFKDVEFCLSSMNLRKKQNGQRSSGDLLSAVKSICVNRCLWHDNLEADLPQTWEKYGDMLLLPSNCFSLDVWKLLGN